MKVSSISILAAAALSIGMVVSPASAGGLVSSILGGGDSGSSGGGGVVSTVTNTVNEVVNTVTETASSVSGSGSASGSASGGGASGSGSVSGGGSLGGLGSTVDSLLAVNNGAAGDDSLVNLGLGGSTAKPNNILDVNLGKTANVNVSGNLGSNLLVGLNLGGLGLDLSVAGLDDLLGGGGGGGTSGPGIRPRVLVANNGGLGANGGVGIGGAGGAGAFQVNCSVNDGRKVLQLAAQAKLNPQSWGRAANVQVVPIKLCAQARNQVAQVFSASGKIQQLQGHASADALITASLSRTRYDINDVFAVQSSGGKLVVYVY